MTEKTEGREMQIKISKKKKKGRQKRRQRNMDREEMIKNRAILRILDPRETEERERE